jgi:hypothetical protein
MSSLAIAFIALACVFGGALLGMYLRKMLPDHHVIADSRALVMLGTGLVGTMAAIVLGMMVSSAKSSYDTQKNHLALMSAKIVLLDRVLVHYGPETAELRALLREVTQRTIDRIWPQDRSQHSELVPAASRSNEALYDQILQLSPTNDTQRALRDRAASLAIDLGETRWLMSEEASNSVAPAFLVILIFWFAMIFVSFGLYTPPNSTVITALFVCALSFSGAILLVLEMYRPYEGLIQISSAPLRDVLAHLGK